MAKGMKPNGLRIAQARMALPGPPKQVEFARTLGIHWVTLCNIENGKANVSLELLERIAEATHTSREHLLGSDEDEEVAPLLSLSDAHLLDVLIEALQDMKLKVAV